MCTKSNEYQYFFFTYLFTQNIVACGAGFVSGLGLGDNTRAAVIRLGMMEMMSFATVSFIINVLVNCYKV